MGAGAHGALGVSHIDRETVKICRESCSKGRAPDAVGGATGTSEYYAELLSRTRNIEDAILLQDIKIGWLPADCFYNCLVDNEPHAPLSAENLKGVSINNKERQGILHDK